MIQYFYISKTYSRKVYSKIIYLFKIMNPMKISYICVQKNYKIILSALLLNKVVYGFHHDCFH